MLGERIRHYRLLKGMKQNKLAEKLFISTSYISALETNEQLPALSIVLKLFDLLDCSPNDLFEYQDRKDENSNISDYKNPDGTISETVRLMEGMSPEAKYKVFSCAQDQAFISKVKSAK